ncbi:MAG: immunogenic protein, partial [Proteobacteria bacterium]|nr:immunogenic protein [Pseudomonadota bacterium]
MMFKRKLGILLAAVIAGLTLAGGATQAQDMKFFRIGTGGA